MELLWGAGEPERPRRGPKPKLTLEQITEAAIALADAEGLEALSMRKVGDKLGVTAMSLYSYVPGKGELLDLMLDRVYGESEPTPPGKTWREQVEHVARAGWAMYLRHPWLLQVAAARPVLGPNTIAKYDYELRALEGIGLSDIEMDLAVAAIGNYVHGAVRVAIEAAQTVQHTGVTDLEWWETHKPLLEKVFDTAKHPVASRVGEAAGEAYGGAVDPKRTFDFGLKLLLDGLESTVRNAKRANRSG